MKNCTVLQLKILSYEKREERMIWYSFLSLICSYK
uniref:Uncharacterized protein n=1 Tax=Siphoviridae sp. ctQ0C17 TaxID=2826325 RepID=A0A8S5NC42_9CAUD|nr:MAG TPA: hypothetical protein [Siphoviridae sp. ctQ0C17]